MLDEWLQQHPAINTFIILETLLKRKCGDKDANCLYIAVIHGTKIPDLFSLYVNIHVPNYAADGQNHGLFERRDRYWEYHTALGEFISQLITMLG